MFNFKLDSNGVFYLKDQLLFFNCRKAINLDLKTNQHKAETAMEVRIN